MITLIGTGHVFNLRDALLEQLEQITPQVVCVELDQQRYQGLMMKQANPEQYENSRKQLPLVYRLLARFQDSMASEYGVIPGEEMLTAIHYAQQYQLPVEFIDMNAQHLFTQMMKQMPLTERFKLFLSGFAGFFVSKKKVEQELEKYHENFTNYLDEVGKRYPTIKYMLIDKRNEHMVNQLTRLYDQYETIVACVGDGHIPGMTELLSGQSIPNKAIRLKELQQFTPKEVKGESGFFSTQYSPPPEE